MLNWGGGIPGNRDQSWFFSFLPAFFSERSCIVGCPWEVIGGTPVVPCAHALQFLFHGPCTMGRGCVAQASPDMEVSGGPG